MLKRDRESLHLYLNHRMIAPGSEPFFPVEGIHDKKYCQDFVVAYRHRFNGWNVSNNKIYWLFQYHKENDKSQYLLQTIGYTNNEHNLLIKNIQQDTDFSKIKYSRIVKHKYLICKTLTKLKNGMFATTTWELHPEDLKTTFVTLLPGREEYDKN